MPTYIIVSPAYARDYSNAKAALADWKAGKDFTLEADGSGPNFGGRYCSIRDFNQVGNIINIRYSKKTRLTIYKPKS